MNKSAHRLLNDLETRIARLEKTAFSEDDLEFYLETLSDLLRALDAVASLERESALLSASGITISELRKFSSAESLASSLHSRLEALKV